MPSKAHIIILRERTGAGIIDCKKALEQARGDLEKAITILKQKGMMLAQEKKDRTAREGVIGSYVHSNVKIAAYVVLSCETDFVARTDEFREFAHELAMHVAAMNPAYIAPQDVPQAAVEQERRSIEEEFRHEKKPKHVIAKIIEGRLEKFYSTVCLVKQPFVKDDTKTVEDLLHEKVARLKENIEIKEFKRVAV